MVNPIIEVCANSTKSCIEAQKGGAFRVELCAGIPEGGTTPSFGEMITARHNIQIKLNIIIRPRSGDFLYNDNEIQAMIHDIQAAKNIGADGVVFGCLTPEGEIDMEKNRALMSFCEGLSTTFHRAFDVAKDSKKALEELIELGFDRVLTSGQCATAPEGKETLKNLIAQAANRIIIMPGCGVNETNIAELAQFTGAQEFHMSARSTTHSQMVYRNENVSMGGVVKIDEFSNDITDSNRVQLSIKALQNV